MKQLAKNQLHTARITGYTSDGAGVCHIAGRAVFVKGALAGDVAGPHFEGDGKCRLR